MTEPNNAVAGDETKKRDEFVRGCMKATHWYQVLIALDITISTMRHLRDAGISSALDMSEKPLPDSIPTRQRVTITLWCRELEDRFAYEYERNAGARRRNIAPAPGNSPPWWTTDNAERKTERG